MGTPDHGESSHAYFGRYDDEGNPNMNSEYPVKDEVRKIGVHMKQIQDVSDSDFMKGLVSIAGEPNYKLSYTRKRKLKDPSGRLCSQGPSEESLDRRVTGSIMRSDTNIHLQHHKHHTAEGKFRQGSLLAPLFKHDLDVAVEYQQRKASQSKTLTYKEQYYKKQEDKLMQHAMYDDKQKTVLKMFQNINQAETDGVPGLSQTSNNSVVDDPMAKYGLQELMVGSDNGADRCRVSQQCNESPHTSNQCIHCKRSQIKIRSQEKQMQVLKNKLCDSRKVEEKVKKVAIRKGPLSRIEAKVDNLEQNHKDIEKYDDMCALEAVLQKTKECNEWLRERNEWLENRLQVLSLQHTQQRNMIQVLGERIN